MKQTETQRKITCALALLALPLTMSCGGDSETTEETAAAADVLGSFSLSSLPSAADMLKSTSSSSSLSRKQGGQSAVSGTAPNLIDFVSSDSESTRVSALDQYVFDGAIAAGQAVMDNNGTPSQTVKDNFFQGMNKCQMIDDTLRVMNALTEGDTSACYMKNVSAVTDASTLGSGSGSLVGLFDEGESDKLVKVNMSEGDDVSEIRILLRGKSTTGGTAYKYHIINCDSGVAGRVETASVDRSTGVYSMTSTGSYGAQTFSQTFSAKLKLSDGAIIYDTAADRELTMSHNTSGSMTYRSSLSVNSSNEIRNKMAFSMSGSGYSFDNSRYSVAIFTGTSAVDAKLTEGAMASGGSSVFGNQTNTFDRLNVGLEYQDTKYATVSSSALVTEVAAQDFSTGFYGESAASVDNSSFDAYCSATADSEVFLDVAQPAMAAIGELCEGKKVRYQDLCFSDSMRDIENYLRFN